MKMRKSAAMVLASVVALAPLSLSAEELRRLMVTGEATMDVAPDQAVISLGVRAQSKEAGEAMEQVSVRMNEVLAALRDSGIAAEDMQTDHISMHPIWSQIREDGQSENAITGFEASNALTVRLTDIDTMGGVLDDVLRAGANEFRGLTFSYSEQDKAEDLLRTQAVEDAYRKARQLAEASGMALGPVRELRDGGAGGGGAPMMAMEMGRGKSVPVAPGTVSLSHSVSVVFDLMEPSGPN